MTHTEFTQSLPLTPRSKKLIVMAAKKAAALGYTYIGTEHFLMALFDDDGVGNQILCEIGADQEKAKSAWDRIRHQEEINALKARISKLEGK